MFGMLDYRAHKLYVLLFYPLIFILRLISIFALPGVSYAIGAEYGPDRTWEIGITILALLLISIIWQIVIAGFVKLIDGAFNFLIDVVPADGRTKEESQQVVWSGEMAIASLTLEKHPSEWTDEALNTVTKGDFISLPFIKKRRERAYALREYFLSNPDIARTEYTIENALEELGLRIPLVEKIIENKLYRGWVISYLFLVWLLIANPMG